MDNISKGDIHAECMPIITPSYPAMNSAHSVSSATLQVMLDEFAIADEMCMRILSSGATQPTEWEQILQPYPFFNSFKKFIKIEISSHKLKYLKKWNQFILSKLRNLTTEIHYHVKVRPWPEAHFESVQGCYFKISYFKGIAKQEPLVHSDLSLSTKPWYKPRKI